MERLESPNRQRFDGRGHVFRQIRRAVELRPADVDRRKAFRFGVVHTRYLGARHVDFLDGENVVAVGVVESGARWVARQVTIAEQPHGELAARQVRFDQRGLAVGADHPFHLCAQFCLVVDDGVGVDAHA